MQPTPTSTLSVTHAQPPRPAMQPVHARPDELTQRVPFGGLDPQSPEAALFEALRPVRRKLAALDGFPPYFVLNAAALAQLCRLRPGNLAVLADLPGMGPVKLDKYGPALLSAVIEQAEVLELPLTLVATQRPKPTRKATTGQPKQDNAAVRAQAVAAFQRGDRLGDVCVALSRAPGSLVEILLELVVAEQRTDLLPWLSHAQLAHVEAAADEHGLDRLQPLHAALQGALPYPLLRLAQGFLLAQRAQS